MSQAQSSRLVDGEHVAKWVGERLAILDWGSCTAIGVERSGELIAGVVYNRYSWPDICMHVAAVEKSGWLTKRNLAVFFGYPFNQLNCKRVTALVPSKNAHALQFDLKLGFQYEGFLRDGMPDDDLIVLGMLKKDCKWLNPKG